MWKWIGVALIMAACGEPDRVDDILALTGDSTAGETGYGASCAICHDADGSGETGIGSDIRGSSEEDLIEAVIYPPTSMEGLDVLADQALADIAAYATTL